MRRAAGLVAIVVLLVGCRVDARVDISVRADGSGTVRATVVLDQEAAQRLGGVSALRLNGLRAAGWSVRTGPRSVTVAHEFVGQDELAARLSDLSGSTRALSQPKLVRHRSTFSSRDALSVDVDLRRLASGVRGDAQLRAALQSAGVDVDALATRLDSEFRNAFHLTVAVHLPDGTSRTVAMKAGSGPSTVAASQVDHDTMRVAAVGIGAVLAATALALFALGFRRRSRRAPFG